MKLETLLLSAILLFFGTNLAFASGPTYGNSLDNPFVPDYTLAPVTDTIPPIEERFGDHISDPNYNPFDLRDPSVVEKEVEYDPQTDRYIISERIGEDYYRAPTYMTFDEYLEHRAKEEERAYFDRLAGVGRKDGKLSDREDPLSRIDVSESLKDRLFGGTGVEIRPQGNIDLTFGVDFQRTENPAWTVRQQRTGGFDFDMDIEMSVEASIGEKLKMSTNYNTQATFDFQNTMKLDYDADAFGEDDIIKTIELGNVSFPLRSTLIKGSQNLFGIHTELQFGRLKLGLVASQQRSQQKSIRIEGGSQVQEFEIRADEYDENRHFLLTHYNRDNFEASLTNLPQIQSLFKVTRLEVWITNDRNDVENIRDIVAVADIGEPTVMTNTTTQYGTPPPPRHLDIQGNALPGQDLTTGVGANDILADLQANSNARQLDDAVATLTALGFQQSKDFEKVSARLLSPNEYTFNPDLGTVSLNVNLRPDQVLGVAFEYDYNGRTYQVGELTREGAGSDEEGELTVLFVKMLKSTTQRIGEPTWDLMMKNFYNIGAFQVDQDNFNFDIFYDDPGRAPKRFIPVRPEDPLLRIFGLDKLNVQGDPCPDGIFDFVPGLTINPRNGRIMFPVLEPFGESLERSLALLPDPLVAPEVDPYIYNELYDRTIVQAREFTEKNRYVMKGDYKSSVSSEISLGSFNLPEGSVIVRAGGRVLVPNQDYTIDYNIGRVKILNDAVLNSGTPVDISFEDNTLISLQQRTMLGLRADYEVNKHLSVGGTYMQLFERPFTQKVNVGDDPINNRVLGLDVTYSKEVPFVTKLVDAIPFIDTKEPSTVNFTAEVAGLKPSHSRAINVEGGGDKGGTVFIDDFEGTTSNNDLRIPANNWALASVPQYAQNGSGSDLLPESALIDNIISGSNRALLNWYRIDQTVQGNNDSAPYTRLIQQDEVFPGRAIQNLGQGFLGTFDLTYYPRLRGPYNFDIPGGYAPYSAGLDNSGQLLEPETRWGGIMRALNTNDFQAANIEYLEFWVLNPFMNADGRTTTTDGGEMYIDLGNISEDILRDSRKFFENGIPVDDPPAPTDQTSWSRIPRTNAVTNAFENNTGDREQQDIGFDGYNSSDENIVYGNWLDIINGSSLNPDAKQAISDDIANDDFVNFRDSRFNDQTSVFERYLRFNNPEGNSGEPQSGVVNSSTNIPDTEDLNNDNTLNETEAYFNYRVEFQPTAIPGPSGEIEIDVENNPFISDVRRVDGTNRVWYRYRIPLDGPDKIAVNGIQDFRSIRFIRMYLTGWRQPVTLRFATLELVRNQWRRYILRGIDTNPCIDSDCEDENVSFEINAVNFEENQGKIPFSYELPPGVQRQQSVNTQYANQFQNEQSLTLEVQDLSPDFSVGAYKIINMDWRVYEKVKMFVHAEAFDDNNLTGIADGDFSLFLRMGSDFEQNYYEYSIPLDMTTDPLEMDPYFLWRTSNNVDIPLDAFKDAKLNRNAQNFDLLDRYTEDYTYEYRFNPDDADSELLTKINKITVKGNPNLGQVKGVMVGLRNNSTQEESIEVWVNELRLTGIDERGGIAALARMDINLADFADVTASANYNSIGWGQLEDNVMDRAREETIGYDLSGSAEIGKFFPEEWGLKVPVFGQISKTVSTPEFDPYDRDLTLDESLSTAETAEERQEIKDRAQDVTEIKSWNVTNLRKERKGGADQKQKPWNIENFDVTYSYTNTLRHNPIIEKDEETVREGRLNYKYNRKAKPIEPFKKLSKSKYLKLITDFNFDLLPTSFAFSTDMIREFQHTRYRFVGDAADDFNKEFYNKQFRWNRSYDLKWDFTKNLKLNFNARNEAVIDELKEINPDGSRPTANAKSDTIWAGIRDFGRNKFYTHRFNVDYKVPIDKIPFLDWVKVKANYNADYSWTAAALNTENLGNVIQNNQTRKFDADLDFTKLYKKSKFLAKVDKKKRKRRPSRNSSKGGKDDKNGKGGKDKKEADKKEEVASKDDKKKTRKKGEISKGAKMAVRPLLFLRKARLSYSQQFSTIIPGFMEVPELLGLSGGFSDPGWGFVAGWQPNINPYGGNDYLTELSGKGLISADPFLNQQVIQNETEQIDLKITLEPFEDFNIDLTANRKFTDNLSLYYKTYEFGGAFDHSLPREFGSYEISFFAMNTLFGNSDQLFAEFLDNRAIISQRIGEGTHSIDGNDFTKGYGRNQQNVLLPAFMAAYTGKDANTIEVAQGDQNYAKDVLFDKLPNINWQVNYKGLSKIGNLANIFSSFNVTHGYRSTLQVNSFVTNQRYNGTEEIYVPNGNFVTRFEVPELVINEQFAPLLGLDVRLYNDMTFKVDFKKSRTLALSLQDNSMNETRSDEYVIGWGYKMKDVYIAFLKGGKKKKRTRGRSRSNKTKKNQKNAPGSKKKKDEASDLNFAFDFSYRNNRSFRNAFDNEIPTSEATRGSKTITINPAVDYDISSRLNARLFFDYTRTIPTTTAQFPTTNIAGGVRIRFLLE